MTVHGGESNGSLPLMVPFVDIFVDWRVMQPPMWVVEGHLSKEVKDEEFKGKSAQRRHDSIDAVLKVVVAQVN